MTTTTINRPATRRLSYREEEQLRRLEAGIGYARRDLHAAIAAGDKTVYRLRLQLEGMQEAATYLSRETGRSELMQRILIDQGRLERALGSRANPYALEYLLEGMEEGASYVLSVAQLAAVREGVRATGRA